MWRRLSAQIRTINPARSATGPTRRAVGSSVAPGNGLRTFAAFSRHFATESVGNATAIRVEDIMPIATGHEREELEAELKIPSLPLKCISCPQEAPAVIKSYYDKRIVGCPGVEGEDEHDVVWFWLEKGKPHECPVCSQYFELEVVGPGGPPDGHGDDEDDHHH
ncbi:hypothetical protein DH2020_012221 [Rehmannia glutinosa]|uniref:Uncharacterized protein n=1 Tax=Rehmannia glutinosa TaxID=99300 RepID=A0ABR0WYS9_REHGL